jgi:hypothetical protein
MRRLRIPTGEYNGRFGGWVKPFKRMTSKEIEASKRKGDTVPTLLQVGEMVIPLKRVRTVTAFLKRKHITFGNFK